MKTKEQLREFYHNGAETQQTLINKLKVRSRGFVTGEIASFLGMLFFVVLITLSDAAPARIIEGLLAVASFALYVIIRNRDVKNSDRMADAERLRKAYAHEEAYLGGDFSAFDDGQRYVDPQHPFTFDLDIFGKNSLYQRINRTVTTGGADRLARCLSLALSEGEGKSNTSKPLNTFDKMEFISCGVDGKIDTDAILRSVPALKEVVIPDYFGGKGIKVLMWCLIIGLFASIVAAIYGFVNPMLPIVWIFVNFFVVQGIANKYLKEMQALGTKLRDQMQPLMRIVRIIGGTPSTLFSTLTDIVETLVLRGNDAYRFFADAFGLRGLALVSKFYHWRNMAIDDLPKWIDAISEIDAEVSKAQFNYNHQSETCIPTILPDGAASPLPEGEGLGERSFSEREGLGVRSHGSVVYIARGLYHPFLGEKAVRNDFNIEDRNFYIITGANMAGKSTFLRAIGVNYILAMNGMPVFADSLTVSRFYLFTSMRTSDDLAHGISYFNAELLRLKQLIQSLPLAPSKGGGKSTTLNTNQPNKANKSNQPNISSGIASDSAFPPPSEGARGRLIILDEILKGTNSLDKLNGSRMFLRAMEDKPVTGVIATHDLELSKMEDESPRFHNYCFEIELGTDVTYSYKIKPGVARNQNATFLLKKLLEDT